MIGIFSNFLWVTFLSWGSQPAFNAQARSGEALGEQRLAVILLKEPHQTAFETPNFFEEVVFSGPNSINSFYRESSYGKTWFQGKVFGWWDLPLDEKGCPLQSQEILRSLENKIDLKKYNRYLFLLNEVKEECSESLGESTHGRVDTRISRGVISASLSRANLGHRLVKPQLPRQKLGHITGTVIAHELGHALGVLSHSNLLECEADVTPTPQKLCKQEAIADMFAIMSGESYFRSSLHHSACHKEDLGWFENQALKKVKISDLKNPKIFLLSPYETSLPGTKVLKINLNQNIPVQNNVSLATLYIEYRTPTGFDIDIQTLSDRAPTVYRNLEYDQKRYKSSTFVDTRGVQIRGGLWRNGHCITSYLFDNKPQSLRYEDQQYSLYDALDSFLLDGEVFYEPFNKISIKVLNVTSSMVTLQVSTQ